MNQGHNKSTATITTTTTKNMILSCPRLRLRVKALCLAAILASVVLQFLGSIFGLWNHLPSNTSSSSNSNNHNINSMIFGIYPTITSGNDASLTLPTKRPATTKLILTETGTAVMTRSASSSSSSSSSSKAQPHPHDRFHKLLRDRQKNEEQNHHQQQDIVYENPFGSGRRRPLPALEHQDQLLQEQETPSQHNHTIKRQSPPPPPPLPKISHFTRVNLLAKQQRESTTGTLFSETSNRQEYQPTGGRLPLETAEYLMDEKMWHHVDNGTCVTTTTTLTISHVAGIVVPNKYNQPTIAITEAMQNDSEFVFFPWQRRAPYAILLGAMKCGTHAITASLWEHPLMARMGHWELHFFDDSDLAIRSEQGIDRLRTLYNYAQAFETALTRGEEYDDNNNNSNNTSSSNNNNHTNSSHNSTTTANNTTSHFVKEDIDWKAIPLSDSTSKSNSLTHPRKYFAIESSPKYLLSSDRIPDILLCTAPWVKLLAVLRDPIRRVESQYKYLDETRKKYERPMVDWDVWIQDDIRLLNAAGVLTAATLQEEVLAWKTYQRRPNSNMIVGRGLYVIQLEQWYAAMDKVGKPRGDLLVLQSEAFRSHRQEEYNRILEFLQLPPHRLMNTTDEHVTTTHEQSIPMPHHIRDLLQELYEPYNQRLYQLLGWDVTRSVNTTTMTASAARWMAADRSTSRTKK